MINLGYLGHMIKDALQEGTDLGVRIQYTQEEAHTLLGSGGGVKNALHLLGDQPFFLASSDIWSTMCLRAFIESANLTSAHDLITGRKSSISSQRRRFY